MGASVTTKSKRARGVLGRGAIWCWQHPGVATTSAGAPLVVGTSIIETGLLTTGFIASGVVGAGVAWWNADPDSYDRIVSPRLRSLKRRYWAYRGSRWTDAMEACELAKEDKRTGRRTTPRLVSVYSVTPSIDVLTVNINLGISIKRVQAAVDELAPALMAESLVISKVPGKPRRIKIVAIRNNPFDELVDAAEIPEDSSEVDFKALPVGENELGDLVTLALLGEHLLVLGAMGSGKAGLIWNPLRSMGPAIRDGLVQVDAIDPKMVELEIGKKLFRRHVTAPDQFLPLIEEFRDRMNFRKEAMQQLGQRKVQISQEMPLNLLVIDELMMLTALSDDAKKINKVLAEIMTQGRALGFVVMAYLQEPNKDVLPIRDLFTRRVCLRAASSTHVDMVLGEGMRDRGALADEILPGDEQAGIGFMVASDFKVKSNGKIRVHAPGDPVRIRLGYVDDADILELVSLCAPNWGADVVPIKPVDREVAFTPLDLEDGDNLDFEPGEIENFVRDGATRSMPAMVPSTLALLDRMSGYQDPADVQRGA